MPLLRRDLLGASLAAVAPAALLNSRSAGAQDAPWGQAPFAEPPPIARLHARADRIIDITVCTRPFRAAGPRIEAERLGRQVVVHNYGHGGSGWSLSWGSAELALALVQATRERHVAVIGCGAIGLTTARTLQRAGYRVTVYARDLPPDVRSSKATGVWSPDSRICDDAHATPVFRHRWEAMARHSHRTYQRMLGLPGEPVEWRDGYVLSDTPFDQPPPDLAGSHPPQHPEPDYPDLEGELLRDLNPRSVVLAPAQHPFPVPYVRRYTQLVFNLPACTQMLLNEFMRDGGEIVHRSFEHPRQFSALKQRTLVNCTGYGARALLGDDSVVPVRGQIARLIPQPEARYGLYWRGHNLNVVSRKDGILVQAQVDGDFDNDDTTPDRTVAEAAVQRLATLFTRA